MLNIQLAEGIKYDQLNIYSAQGQLLYQEQLTTQLVAEVELTALPSGVYFLEIQYDGTQRELRKVVKI
ncbi:MAG: T9SS type A sorting domain-containing protein [Bacteroidota bacterium]